MEKWRVKPFRHWVISARAHNSISNIQPARHSISLPPTRIRLSRELHSVKLNSRTSNRLKWHCCRVQSSRITCRSWISIMMKLNRLTTIASTFFPSRRCLRRVTRRSMECSSFWRLQWRMTPKVPIFARQSNSLSRAWNSLMNNSRIDRFLLQMIAHLNKTQRYFVRMPRIVL